MKKRLTGLTLAILLTALLAGCATTQKDSSQAYKGESPQKIFNQGRADLIDRGYGEAIKRFEALDIQYPFNKETEKAQLYLIYAYYKKEEFALASAAADRYIRLHPASRHVDYAYYMRGLSNYYKNMGLIERTFKVDLSKRDVTQIKSAYYDFRQVAKRFPHSTYAASAHQYMIYLRNMLANHDYAIADYYFKRGAYVASSNRASDVVAHYQGAPVVVNALKLMVKSYNKLGLTKAAQEAMLVLKYNYPKAKVNL